MINTKNIMPRHITVNLLKAREILKQPEKDMLLTQEP